MFAEVPAYSNSNSIYIFEIDRLFLLKRDNIGEIMAWKGQQ